MLIDPKLYEVTNFVRVNIVPVAEGRKCVDGRYLPDQDEGMIARPGGDGGYVLALLALNRKKHLGLSPEECFNAIYKAVVRGNGRFYIHTDHQTDPEATVHHGLIGCGHLSRAASENLSRSYGVSSSDVKRVIAYAREVSEINPAIEMVNLRGGFDETGVLVVKSSRYTINAEDYSFQRMYFVYDEDRDIAFMKQLVNEMRLVGVSFADLKRESDIQLEATLRNLAMGLPVYIIRFLGSRPHIVFSHFVS